MTEQDPAAGDRNAEPRERLWTVGHSNRSLYALLELLFDNQIQLLVDVRRVPASRRHPHFSKERLSEALAIQETDYLHLEELGGHRDARADSPHVQLPPGPFRGYADHMDSAEFRRGLDRLRALARERRTVVMCAEGKWQECHRRLLSDKLVTEGVAVEHLAVGAAPTPHALHPRAELRDGKLVYAKHDPTSLFG